MKNRKRKVSERKKDKNRKKERKKERNREKTANDAYEKYEAKFMQICQKSKITQSDDLTI